MKIIISSTGDNINSQASPIFGRCSYFVLVETKDKQIINSKSIINTAVNQGGGAGITAGQIVGNSGANIIISQAIGPRAFDILNQLNMDIYIGRTGTVKENIEAFLNGELNKTNSAPGPMGAGMGSGRGTGRGLGRR